MAFGSLSGHQTSRPVAEVNMIPLIDVMLVILVIFIMAAPLLVHAVKIELPRAASSVDVPKPGNIELTLDAQAQAYWNGEIIGREEWRARMQQAASAVPQPELRIRADGDLAYRLVAQVMSDAAQAGIGRIGFVTDPRAAD